MSLLRDIHHDAKSVIKNSDAARARGRLSRLAPAERFGYRLPIKYANNDFLLTPDGAWAGFLVPHKPWGYLDSNKRKAYFHSARSAFERIFPSGVENSGHLLVTNQVYSADDWEQALLAKNPQAASAFPSYVRASRKAIERAEFFERETYLFTRLGDRGARRGVRGFARSIVEFWATGAGMDDSQPERGEREAWLEQSITLGETLGSSWLQAQPIHRRRLEWLVRHLDTPGLPTPDVAPADAQEWGDGEWRTALASYTREVDLGVDGKNRLRCVQFDAPTGSGTTYAAYLPLNHIPMQAAHSIYWAHHASSLPFPVDISLHFEVIDPDRASKDLDRPMDDAQAQEEEDRDAGVRTDEITQAQQHGLSSVRTQVQMGRRPLTYWQAVFCVYDTNKEALRGKVAQLIRHYKDIQMELVCPNMDQRELFYQSFPGSDIEVKDWMHRTDPEYLAAAMPWLTNTVGDREGHGLYQGYTIVHDNNGAARKGVPVFYELQSVVDEEGRAPTEAVAADSGSGKTVSRGLKCAHEDALRNITQFVWDPKGDFLPLKRYAKQMRLDPDKVKLVDLYDPNNSVSLDAFAIADVDPARGIDERQTSALNVLFALLPEFLSDQHRGLEYRNLLRKAVNTILDRESTRGEVPTMHAVLDLFRIWAEGDFSDTTVPEENRSEWPRYARMVHDTLNDHARSALGRLLFRDPREAGVMKVTEGDLVLFVAINMKTTQPGEKPTEKTLLSDVISGLMTDFIRSLLYVLPDEVAKSVVLDEWHVIKRSPSAEALFGWLKRMGRSKRTTVRFLSQSAEDFDVKSLSTVWCGKVESEDEAELSCNLLGIEASEANVNLLLSLGVGQFLFRDAFKRISLVQVDIWDQWLLDKFNTQAVAKAALLAEMRSEIPSLEATAAPQTADLVG